MSIIDHNLGVPQFFGSPPRADRRKAWHSARKNPDGTYTIMASYNHLKNVQADDGGDYLIQTYQPASSLAKFIGGFLGLLCLSYVIGWATVIFIGAQGVDPMGAYMLGMFIIGPILACLIGEQITRSVMGRRVHIVQEKIKMRF
jgi:hypothetical protein